MSKKSGIGKLLLGLGAGVGLGVLFAPKKGSETRADIKNKATELANKVKELDVEEVKDHIEDKLEEIKKELDDLDKEKVLKIAKKKSEEIKKQVEELYENAKDKATPVVNDAIEALRVQAVNVTKKVLDKLEKENKETKQK